MQRFAVWVSTNHQFDYELVRATLKRSSPDHIKIVGTGRGHLDVDFEVVVPDRRLLRAAIVFEIDEANLREAIQRRRDVLDVAVNQPDEFATALGLFRGDRLNEFIAFQLPVTMLTVSTPCS